MIILITGVYVFERNDLRGVINNGIFVGDIIVEFDSKPVASVDNLHKYLTEDIIGKKVTVGVLRGGIKQNVIVVPGEIS